MTATQLEETARQLLIAVGCHELARVVRVRWNPRLRTTAGLAYYRQWLVTLNPKLAEFGPGEIEKTLRHELAHLLARFRAGHRRIAPHGPEWRQACAELGLPDENRCHSLPFPRRQVERKHAYVCPSCQLEVRRVRPFRRRVACLACCRKFSRGRYDERFRLLKIEPR